MGELMNELDLTMSRIMKWEVHEGLNGIFDRYFVVKDLKNTTGYTTSGVDQSYYYWSPSTDIKQALRVTDELFSSYSIQKNDKEYSCLGSYRDRVFKGEAETIEKAICLSLSKAFNYYVGYYRRIQL